MWICFWNCVPSPSKFSCARDFSLNCDSRWARTQSEHFSYVCRCSCIVYLCSVTVWQALFRVKFSRHERQADMKTCPTRLHPYLRWDGMCRVRTPNGCRWSVQLGEGHDLRMDIYSVCSRFTCLHEPWDFLCLCLCSQLLVFMAWNIIVYITGKESHHLKVIVLDAERVVVALNQSLGGGGKSQKEQDCQPSVNPSTTSGMEYRDECC